MDRFLAKPAALQWIEFADADAVFEEPEVQICGESAELFQVLEGR